MRCWEGPGVSKLPSFLKKYKSQRALRADIFHFEICSPWLHWFWGSDSTLYVSLALASFQYCELFLQKQLRNQKYCMRENEYQVIMVRYSLIYVFTKDCKHQQFLTFIHSTYYFKPSVSSVESLCKVMSQRTVCLMKILRRLQNT